MIKHRFAGFPVAVGVLTVGMMAAFWIESGHAQLALPSSRATVSQDDVVVASYHDATVPERILEYQGIEPNVEGCRYFLQTLMPDHPDNVAVLARAREWIVQLADKRYDVRRSARASLIKMPRLPITELNAAASSENPEVASAAKAILKTARRRAPRDSIDGITTAVCKIIVALDMKGLAPQLLDCIPIFTDKETLRHIQAAMSSTAVPEDLDQFLETIGETENGRHLRVAALGGLVAIEAKESGELADLLLSLVKDEDEAVKMLAARELANLGHRESLESLLELMDSDELEFRMHSNRVLRMVTDHKFDYYAFEDSEKRTASIDQWKQWLNGDGASVKLIFPLVEINYEVGRILVSDYSEGKVVELDLQGKEVWKVAISNPWGVVGLPNGNRLVAQYEPSGIIEYNNEGEVVWKKEGVPGNVMGIARLENGNTLAACSANDKIIEYDPEGQKVWELATPGRPTDVQNLENGNILVTLMNMNQVIEVNRQGETVWELATETHPLHATRTTDGKTLVTTNNSNAAIEYSMDGKVLRRIELDANCTAVGRMANGDTVVSTEGYVRLLSPEGKVRWQYKGLTYCYGVDPY